MTLHASVDWKLLGRIVASWCLIFLCGAPLRSQTAGSPGQQPGWLLNKGSWIEPGDLPLQLASALEQSGARMMSADKAQLTVSGTITDGQGSRSAQFAIQAPGYLIYRDGHGHAVGFDGNAFKGNSGALNSGDEAITESLLAHFPDMVCLQVAAGGSYRRIGSHFRPDGSNSGNYAGPYWTVLAFSAKRRPGLTAGKALQQELFIAIDEHTGFISEVRVVANTGQQLQTTQSQFSNWSRQGDQWFPASIVRLENGKQVLSFQVQAASVGPAGPIAAFLP